MVSSSADTGRVECPRTDWQGLECFDFVDRDATQRRDSAPMEYNSHVWLFAYWLDSPASEYDCYSSMRSETEKTDIIRNLLLIDDSKKPAEKMRKQN